MSVSQDQGLPSQGQTQTSVQSSGQQRCGWPSWPPPPSPPTAPTPRSSPHSIPVTVLCRLESGSGRGGAWALPPQAPGLPTPQAEGSCPGHMSPERAPAPAKRPCGPWTRGSHPRFLWVVRAASGPGLQTGQWPLPTVLLLSGPKGGVAAVLLTVGRAARGPAASARCVGLKGLCGRSREEGGQAGGRCGEVALPRRAPGPQGCARDEWDSVCAGRDPGTALGCTGRASLLLSLLKGDCDLSEPTDPRTGEPFPRGEASARATVGQCLQLPSTPGLPAMAGRGLGAGGPRLPLAPTVRDAFKDG